MIVQEFAIYTKDYSPYDALIVGVRYVDGEFVSSWMWFPDENINKQVEITKGYPGTILNK